MSITRRWKTVLVAGAGVVLTGGLAVGVISAANAQSDATTRNNPGYGAPGYGDGQDRGPGGHAKGGGTGDGDQTKTQRSDETLLTGDDAEKAKAAALAKYPDATIQRVETDSDGVYEAHLTTADGKRMTAELDKDFTVTGEETGGPR
jgi:hypothetical protein